jgi:osmoprotectant transport system substrate-binding protein
VRRILGIGVIALVLATACAGSKTATTTAGGESAKPVSGPTITIGSANFTESLVLQEIYAQALKAKGYTISEKANIGSREVYFKALESGAINFFPEYIGSALNFLTKQTDASKPDPKQTYDLLQTQLKQFKLTALQFSAAADQDAAVANKETAAKYNLKNISDLKPYASQLYYGGPPECPKRIACLKGLEDVYGLHFKGFKSLDAGGSVTVQALKSNAVQVADLFTTDARIVANGFVVLKQDKQPIVGAENVAPIVSDTLVTAYGTKFSDLVNSISSKLTSDGLLQLNKSVDIDKEDAKAVAARWLRQNGFV